MFTLSQAFDAGKLGVERVGVYGYVGQRPTVYETSGGEPDRRHRHRQQVVLPGRRGGRLLPRATLEFLPFYMHGSDNAYLATGTPGDQALPADAQDPTWNGCLLETHYYVNPQLMLTQRTGIIRMSQQARLRDAEETWATSTPSPSAIRWYPIMFSRAGLGAARGAGLHQDDRDRSPERGRGGPPSALAHAHAVRSTSVLLALDFDF